MSFLVLISACGYLCGPAQATGLSIQQGRKAVNAFMRSNQARARARLHDDYWPYQIGDCRRVSPNRVDCGVGFQYEPGLSFVSCQAYVKTRLSHGRVHSAFRWPPHCVAQPETHGL